MMGATREQVVLIGTLLLIPFAFSDAIAESVPDWVKNTALWYGNGEISETEFLNAIKFLIENEIIVLESASEIAISGTLEIIIPNGNAEMGNTGFYLPLHPIISEGTTITWINHDDSIHTIQSQDEDGNPIGIFSSSLLNTEESYSHTFDESGIYNYYCTIHPWRVGIITVQ